MKNKTALVITSALAIVVLAGTALWWSGSRHESRADLSEISLNTPDPEPQIAITEDIPQDLPAPEGIEPAAAADVAPAQDAPLQGPISTPAAAPVSIIVEGTDDPKQPRSVGRTDAPVTMVDYSSLTCPHCAEAHEKLLPLLIRDYVETGKLRIIFNDFPLNPEAVAASKISRCMPNDKYYSFVSLLFSSIEQWAPKVPDSLVQYATLAGLPADKARACLNDTDLETALIQGVRDASQQHQITATPTFSFNDGKKIIQGARPYIEFQMAIDGLIEEAKDAAKAK